MRDAAPSALQQARAAAEPQSRKGAGPASRLKLRINALSIDAEGDEELISGLLRTLTGQLTK